MTKWIASAAAIIVINGMLALGCQEEMVGAPCVPETDEGDYNENLGGDTVYSIETRSVQCKTRMCLIMTTTQTGGMADQLKYSFCSCRCKDAEGHSYENNPDKYDDLCECPPNTLCEHVLDDLEDAPEKVTGAYCIPKCIAEPCEEGQCSPSKDSEEPWKWYCAD